jgi:NADP-dependent aldehyde dehydrogenase
MSLAAAESITAINPRSGQPTGQYLESTDSEYEHALSRAVSAARSAALADRSKRSAGLLVAASRLRHRAGEIVATAEVETGLPENRLRGELQRTCVQLEMFAAVVANGDYVEPIIDPADADAAPTPRPDLRRFLIPIGPIVVFGASNFPLAFSTAGGDTASALAAGCPVIVKGHPAHPGTALLVAAELTAAFQDAGLPRGTFAQLTGAGNTLGERLVDDDRIQAVAFTGSLQGGRAIADRAAARPRPIPVYAEMSSLNPLIVTPGAAAERAAQIAAGLSTSVASFGGQLCTKPGVAFVPNDAGGHELLAKLAASLSAQPPEILLTRQIRDRFQSGLLKLASAPGVTRPTTARQREDDPGFYADPALFIAPLEQIADTEVLRQEHFGPAIIAFYYDELSFRSRRTRRAASARRVDVEPLWSNRI